MFLLEHLVVDQGEFDSPVLRQADFLYGFSDRLPYIARGQIGRSQICPQLIRNCEALGEEPVFCRGQVKDALPDHIYVDVRCVEEPLDFVFHATCFQTVSRGFRCLDVCVTEQPKDTRMHLSVGDAEFSSAGVTTIFLPVCGSVIAGPPNRAPAQPADDSNCPRGDQGGGVMPLLRIPAIPGSLYRRNGIFVNNGRIPPFTSVCGIGKEPGDPVFVPRGFSGQIRNLLSGQDSCDFLKGFAVQIGGKYASHVFRFFRFRADRAVPQNIAIW